MSAESSERGVAAVRRVPKKKAADDLSGYPAAEDFHHLVDSGIFDNEAADDYLLEGIEQVSAFVDLCTFTRFTVEVPLSSKQSKRVQAAFRVLTRWGGLSSEASLQWAQTGKVSFDQAFPEAKRPARAIRRIARRLYEAELRASDRIGYMGSLCDLRVRTTPKGLMLRSRNDFEGNNWMAVDGVIEAIRTLQELFAVPALSIQYVNGHRDGRVSCGFVYIKPGHPPLRMDGDEWTEEAEQWLAVVQKQRALAAK